MGLALDLQLWGMKSKASRNIAGGIVSCHGWRNRLVPPPSRGYHNTQLGRICLRGKLPMSGSNEPLAGKGGIGSGPNSSGSGVDPYYRLLSISPRQRKFGVMDHFTLLGVEFGEGDPIIIENAVDQRIQHLRTFRLSQEFGKVAEQLMTEVSAARLVLMNEGKREAYVRELTAGQQSQAAAPTPIVPMPTAQALPRPAPQPVRSRALPTAAPLPAATAQPASLQFAQNPMGGKAASTRRPKGKSTSRLVLEIVGGGLAGLVVAALLMQFVFGVDILGLNSQKPQRAPIASRKAKADEQIAGTEAISPRSSGSEHSGTQFQPLIAPSPASQLPAEQTGNSVEDPGAAVTTSNPTPEVGTPEPTSTATPLVPSAIAPEAPTATTKKLPIPSVEERTRAAEEIENVFGVTAGIKTTEDKSVVATKMHQAALETNDATIRFALLQGAMHLFGTSGDIKSALAILDLLTEQYEIDPLKVKLATLPDYAQAVSADAELRLLGEIVAAAIQQAVIQDQFEAAIDSVESLRRSERLQKDRWIASALDDARKSLKAQKLQWDKFAAAQATLAANPNDGEANLAAGLWFCSQKRDWPTGLPYLAKSGDAAIQAAAQADLATPVKNAEQLALADAWFDLGLRQPKPGESQSISLAIFQQRARHWYRLALPATEGLERARVVKRISEIAPSGQAAIPKGAAQFQRHSYAVLPRGMSWHQAYQVCEALGGYPARIESDAENSFVSDLARAGGEELYWIDASDEVKEGEWRHSDGRKVDYTRWDPGEPQGGKENHVAFSRNGTWHDSNTGIARRPICEWSVPLEAPGAAELIDDVAPRVDEIRQQLLTRFSADEGGPKTRIPREAVRFQGHRYLVVPTSLTWHLARFHCTEVGGHLVRIDSAEEMQFVRKLIEKGESEWYWVDLCREYVESGWRQSNGKLIVGLTIPGGEGPSDYGAVSKAGDYKAFWGGGRMLCVCEWDE
jgi:hypothetical protein